MWRTTKRTGTKLARVLAADAIPVWLSLTLMLLGAAATYYIAPLINEQFEIQAARREFLIKNLDDFSTNTKSLLDVVSKGINEASQRKYDALISEANPSIAKLQFSATQLIYIVPQESKLILEFQRTLVAMQDTMLAHKVGTGSSEILQQSKSLMKQSILIYDALLRKVGFASSV